MNPQGIYEALARGERIETQLPALLQSLDVEALVLFYAGEEQAYVAFRRTNHDLLEQTKNKLVARVTSARQSAPTERAWTPFGGVWLCLPHEAHVHVDLALSEADLHRLSREPFPSHVKLHLISFGDEVLGGLGLITGKTEEEARVNSETSWEEVALDVKVPNELLVALGIARQIEASRRANEDAKDRLERLAHVGHVFAEGLPLDRTLARLLEIALHIAGSSIGVVKVTPFDGETVLEPISWGLPPDWVDLLRFKEGELVTEVVMSKRKPVYLDSLNALETTGRPKFLKSLTVVPLSYEGGTLGCMCIANPPPSFYQDEAEQSTLMTLASLVGGAIQSARHLQSEIKAQRLREEMKLAAQVQLSLLPRELPSGEQVRVAASIRAARQLGGDFYDILDLGQGRWGIMIADVSGKGPSAALLMATARAYLHIFARQETSPGAVLEKMNRALTQDFTDGRFLTAAYLLVDVPQRRLQMAGAGHHPIYLLSGEGAMSLSCDDLPLGLDAGSSYRDASMELKNETTILLYTDGLVEAASPSGKFFGDERMASFLNGKSAPPAQQLVDRLIREVEVWTEGAALRDDLTILAVAVS